MTISTFSQITCDWCEETRGLDDDPDYAWQDLEQEGWVEDSGRHFCCETCFDKHMARVSDTAHKPTETN